MLCALGCCYPLDVLEHQACVRSSHWTARTFAVGRWGIEASHLNRGSTAFLEACLYTSVKYCDINDFPTFPVNFASPQSTKWSRLYEDPTALQPVFLARRTLLPVARSFSPAKIRSSCPRLRANFSQQFGCWMVNCSSEGSGVNILAGARVRQAACFAVPGCLGHCCAFYRY